MSNTKGVSGLEPSSPNGHLAGANAQAHFYPAWWTYIGTPTEFVPTYKVVCSSEQEIDLARRVKPEHVNAHFVLADPAPTGPVAGRY